MAGINKIFVRVPKGEVKLLDGDRKTITAEGDTTAFHLAEVPTETPVTLYVNGNSVRKTTRNIRETLANAKWVYISRGFWVRAINNINVSKHWGDWPGMHSNKEEVEKYGIGKQYKKAEQVTLTPSNDEYDFSLGNVYYVTAFCYYPEMRTYKQGAYIALLGKPKITWAYFPEQKKEDKFPAQLHDGLHVYGNTVELTIFTHLLSDPRKQAHLWSERARKVYEKEHGVKKEGHEFISFEIHIHDADTGKPVTEKPIIYAYDPDNHAMDYNTKTKINIVIDKNWRKISGHKKDETKTYYAVIQAYSHYNPNAIKGGKPSHDRFFAYSINGEDTYINELGDEIKARTTAEDWEKIQVVLDTWVGRFNLYKTLPSKERVQARTAEYKKTPIPLYNMMEKSKGVKWQRFSDTKNDYEPIPAQWYFKVKWDSMASILEQIELSKTNMIAAIGDIQFTQKEYDPCGYSKITIQEGKRPPFVLFDQDELSKNGDKTQEEYEIIAGESPKKVSIKVHDLENEKVKCDSVLLPSGEKHDTLERVFQMERIVQPQLINDEPYATKNALGKYNYNKKLEDGLGNSEYNKDVDKYGGNNPIAGNTVDGAIIQGWQKGKDYDFSKDGTAGLLTLKSLKYEFNKTYDTNIANFLGIGENRTYVDSFVDLAWIFRYMFFWQDKHKQIYFIPISTCRYPNQIAKIAVYPSIEWGLDFDFGITRPQDKILVYERENIFDILGFGSTLAAQDDDKINYNINIGFVYLIDKQKVEFEISQAKKLLSIISFALKARSKLQAIIGGSSKSANKNAAKKLTGKLAKRFNKLPFSLTILSPAISAGFSFKPIPHKDRAIVPVQAKIYVNANPLFGAQGTLDILAMLGLLPYVGQGAKVTLAILDVLGVKLKFDLSLIGELGLLIEDTFIINELDNTSFNAKLQGRIGFKAEVGADVSGKGVRILMGVKEASLMGVGETYLLPMLGAGYNDKGIYIDLRIDFAGLVVKVVGKTTKKEGKKTKDGEKPKKALVEPDDGSTTSSWIILNPIPELIGKRFYLDRDVEPTQYKAEDHANYFSEGTGGFDD